MSEEERQQERKDSVADNLSILTERICEPSNRRRRSKQLVRET
jgi:hypothetical protein